MEIKDLIERILESTPPSTYSHFIFTLEDTKAKCREYAMDCNGDRVADCDYYVLSTDTRFEIGVDDAVAFLFDCDIHLWELVSYEVDMSMYCTSRVWKITLRR